MNITNEYSELQMVHAFLSLAIFNHDTVHSNDDWIRQDYDTFSSIWLTVKITDGKIWNICCAEKQVHPVLTEV